MAPKTKSSKEKRAVKATTTKLVGRITQAVRRPNALPYGGLAPDREWMHEAFAADKSPGEVWKMFPEDRRPTKANVRKEFKKWKEGRLRP